MNYRAVLTIDFTNQQTNQYQKLVAALLQNDWKYLETSALAIETTDLRRIWAAFDLIPRQAADAGLLSALSIHVQGSDNFTSGIPYVAAGNHPHATSDIKAKQFP